MTSKKRRQEHPNKIRNGKIRRDFMRLLEIIVESDNPTNEALAETEEIADSHAIYFNDEGRAVSR